MPSPDPEPLRYGMILPNGQPLRYGTPGARWGGTVAEVMAALEPTPKPPRKMAKLTDADQKAFINKILATLKNADIKARLIAKEWDPTQRTTNLENGNTSILNDESLVTQLEAALTTAVNTRRTDLNNNYDLASAALSSIEGALGKDDPLVQDLHQFRGSLSQAPKPPAGGTT